MLRTMAAMGSCTEISGQGIIRGNIVRRNGSSGILVATSKNLDIHDNRLEDNLRGIQYSSTAEPWAVVLLAGISRMTSPMTTS